VRTARLAGAGPFQTLLESPFADPAAGRPRAKPPVSESPG